VLVEYSNVALISALAIVESNMANQ
jgi:hypothetical protein